VIDHFIKTIKKKTNLDVSGDRRAI